MKRNEIRNIVQPIDSSKPCVIMVYDKGTVKPIFNKAISCTSKENAKAWLKEKGYKKKKELGYYSNRKKDRIANILPTTHYK